MGGKVAAATLTIALALRRFSVWSGVRSDICHVAAYEQCVAHRAYVNAVFNDAYRNPRNFEKKREEKKGKERKEKKRKEKERKEKERKGKERKEKKRKETKS